MEASLTEEYTTTFRRFAELFGVRRERASIPRLAEAACKEGFAVIAVRPGGKEPICTLTPAQRKKADQEARDATREAGRKRWEDASHDCGRSHAITDPKEARRVFTRLEKQGPVNIGAHPGKSGWVAVDADQAEDVEAWQRHWAAMSGDESLIGGAPTVSSPGVFRGEEWKHKGGGHVWYWLPPEISFAECDINTPMAYRGAQVYFADALILLPPSVRPEGEYLVQSDACQAPAWLVDALLDHIADHTEKAERYTNGARDGDPSPIDRWAVDQTWDELLSADGWRYTHKADKCSCPIWTRPGDDAGSDKSATAHEAGCLRFGDDDDFPGFLHVWSDNAPGFLRDYVEATGRKSISKFNYLSWRDYAGDGKAAFRGLGLTSDAGSDYADMLSGSSEISKTEPIQSHLGVLHLTDGVENGEHKTPGQSTPEKQFSKTENEEMESTELTDEERLTVALVAQLPALLRGPVSHELTSIRSRKIARAIDDQVQLRLAEQEDTQEMAINMTTAFAAEYEDEEYTVTGLLSRSSKALFTAPAKAGKTTTMASLVYALTRGEPFLGQFSVPDPQNVFIIDTEMTPRKHVEWMRDVGMDPSKASVAYMRGRAHNVDLRSEAAQARWSKLLRSHNAQVLIIDPLSPILAGLGLDENAAQDVQAYLAGVDSLIIQADLTGAIVVHHHGHSGERGRGSSAFLGWPDAIWTLVKDDTDIRYFAALGRDIEVPESALSFDPETRRVAIPDVGARRQSKADAKKGARDSDVLACIRSNQPVSGKQLSELMEVPYNTVARSLERLELADEIRNEVGPKNAKLWRIA